MAENVLCPLFYDGGARIWRQFAPPPGPELDMGESAVPENSPAPHLWRKSTKSSYGGCVEVRFLDGGVEVRHSREPDGSILTFTVPEWNAFLAGVKVHEFDYPST